MRKRVLSAVVAMVLLCSASIQACVLRMAAETDFPPHLILREQGWQGQSVELLQLLVKEVGCELEFVNSPWLRSLAQLKSGELDSVICHTAMPAKLTLLLLVLTILNLSG
jgi:polar amino acid transport system substrate-binding protein